MLKKILLAIIELYQKTISPDHSKIGNHLYPYGYCKYTPSCSQYSYEAINNYGSCKGFYLSIMRILRCNPWSKGGYDPVKNINK